MLLMVKLVFFVQCSVSISIWMNLVVNIRTNSEYIIQALKYNELLPPASEVCLSVHTSTGGTPSGWWEGGGYLLLRSGWGYHLPRPGWRCIPSQVRMGVPPSKVRMEGTPSQWGVLPSHWQGVPRGIPFGTGWGYPTHIGTGWGTPSPQSGLDADNLQTEHLG